MKKKKKIKGRRDTNGYHLTHRGGGGKRKRLKRRLHSLGSIPCLQRKRGEGETEIKLEGKKDETRRKRKKGTRAPRGKLKHKQKKGGGGKGKPQLSRKKEGSKNCAAVADVLRKKKKKKESL